MRIARIECTPFSLPLRQPVRFARGELARTNHVLLEVVTDAGIVGRAEAPSRPFFYGESQKSVIAAIEDWVAPAIVGLDPFRTERVRALLAGIEHNNTVKGAIDLALHDIVGQATGVSCHRLLGGAADDVRVTYVCGLEEPEAMAEEAAGVNATHGIDCFKLKVGLDPAKDVRMLRAVRAALPEALLYVDGNQGMRADEALRVLDAAAEVGVVWAEEPCAASDRAGRRRLARMARVSILGDESCRTVEEVAREIADETVDLVSIKVARTGYLHSREIVGACAGAGVRPMVGSQGDSGIGVLAGLHFAAACRLSSRLPAELSFFLNLADDLLEEPPRIEAGRMRVPDVPGIGIRIDRDRLRHHRVDG